MNGMRMVLSPYIYCDNNNKENIHEQSSFYNADDEYTDDEYGVFSTSPFKRAMNKSTTTRKILAAGAADCQHRSRDAGGTVASQIHDTLIESKPSIDDSNNHAIHLQNQVEALLQQMVRVNCFPFSFSLYWI
jgi:hypothetical protein